MNSGLKRLLLFTIFMNQNLIKVTSQEVLYYGFFFDESTSHSLKALSDSYLTKCIDNITEFKSFLEDSSNRWNVSDINSYYTKPLDPNSQSFDPYYHVTAKYCGDTNCNLYATSVDSSLNEVFEMHLIGFVFTNRTFGLRVNLTAEERLLFDFDSRKTLFNSHFELERSQLPENIIRQGNQTYESLQFISQDENFNPTNDRPHVTLGCAPQISAVTTGLDLLEIIQLEHRPNETVKQYFTLDDGIMGAQVVQYEDKGETYFVIYPNAKAVANATFKPYYQNSAGGRYSSGNVMLIFGIVLVILNYNSV